MDQNKHNCCYIVHLHSSWLHSDDLTVGSISSSCHSRLAVSVVPQSSHTLGHWPLAKQNLSSDLHTATQKTPERDSRGGRELRVSTPSRPVWLGGQTWPFLVLLLWNYQKFYFNRKNNQRGGIYTDKENYFMLNLWTSTWVDKGVVFMIAFHNSFTKFYIINNWQYVGHNIAELPSFFIPSLIRYIDIIYIFVSSAWLKSDRDFLQKTKKGKGNLWFIYWQSLKIQISSFFLVFW